MWKPNLFILPILVLLSVSCSSRTLPPEHTGGPKQQVTKITFQRSVCFGECPVYKVTFHRDGGANYLGEFYVKRKGSYGGYIYHRQFDRLVKLLESQDFFRMNDQYPDNLENLTDAPVNQLSVESDVGRKTVRYMHDYEPVELWAVELGIDAITEEIGWKKEK